MFEIHYKYTDYQTFKQTFRELFFPFLIIFQPLIRISNTYKLETTGTIASGNTKGNWRMEKSNIILMPEKSKITYETLGDTIVEVEEYRPFCDTLKAKVKKNKIIISRNPYNEITLRKIKAIR